MAEYEITSPLPGIFYRRPDPDSDYFVEEGAVVPAQAVVGLIELMKQFSEVNAEGAGRNIRYLLSDGDEVDIGQIVAVYVLD